MVFNHEQKHNLEAALEADDSYIQRRADQGVSNVYGGEVELYGEGRDQSPYHPVALSENVSTDSTPKRHRKPRGTSFPQVDEPDFRVPTFHVQTEQERAENLEGLDITRQIARGIQLRRAALSGDPAEVRRTLAMQRRADDLRK